MTTDERLAGAVARTTGALEGVIGDLNLTNDELMAVLGFLAEVGHADEFVLLSDVLGLSRQVDDQTHAAEGGTASNVLGPFYRPGAPWIDNPGSIVDPSDGCEQVVLSGRVTDAIAGLALAGAVVDVWQANADGVYSNEDASLAPWNLRGRQRTNPGGEYRITTVRPKHYTVKDDGPVGRLLTAVGRHPWRPAHIHLLVTADGYRPLVTQVYPAGGPYLDDDAISGVKDDLVVPVVDGGITFDIRVNRGV